jgi:phosphatidylserine decarboxylase
MIPVTRHGWREMLIGSLVIAAVVVGISQAYFIPDWLRYAALLLPLATLIWLFAFFRDPERSIPVEQHAMVSPADGKVSDIEQLPNHELLGGPCVRVGIFLSVFNVHMNRAPCDGTVREVLYKRGKFINAMKHNEASSDNESNTVVLAETESDRPIAVVKQIVGLIARRIICTVEKGETVTRGQRIGMIKFGSRTELYIPSWLEPEIKVQVGDTVRGAQDIIAVLHKPVVTRVKKLDDEEYEPIVGRESPA